MPSHVFNKLCQLVAPYLHSQDNIFREGIKGEEWVMLGLSVLAGSKRFTMSSSDWQRGATTMWKALYRFSDVVNSKLGQYLIKFPVGNEAVRSAREMMKLSGIPNIVGIVDGTHTAINRPVDSQQLYFNRKKYHSLNHQLICDGYRRIIDCSLSHPGSFHDGRIWRRSSIKHRLDMGQVLQEPGMYWNGQHLPMVGLC